jgi:DMSO/TMAO reductase YedYZ molybdopterin-dependent catalytic subunit
MNEQDQIGTDEEIEQRIRLLSRRSFLRGAVVAGAGLIGWQWLDHQRLVDGIGWPFRVALEANENLARDYFSSARLAPQFPRSRVSTPMQNGDIGLGDDFDPDAWKLKVVGLADTEGSRTLTLDEIRALPPVEMITELKCIEGWSVVVQWKGARLADLAAKYPPARIDDDHGGHLPGYVGIETPDGAYYVGLDMESAMHPQTLLCYEMNGAPLALEHGAPLRLVIPVKYGIKHIKRIGTIRFTDRRPADYWAEQGYDWYAGH